MTKTSAHHPPTEIDELAQAARTDATTSNVNRLWQAVYRLDQWWLLPTGDAVDPRPMVGVVEDRTFLLAFTSDQRVRDFAVARGLEIGERDGPGEGPQDGVPAMSVTPRDMTGMAAALVEQNIAGILFDQGVNGFVAPIAGLQEMWVLFSGSQ